MDYLDPLCENNFFAWKDLEDIPFDLSHRLIPKERAC